MIRTSRNVSTFFFLTLSHTRSENVRCQSWMLQREHAVRNNVPNVPAGGKMSPQCPGLGNHMMATRWMQIRGPKMAFGQAKVSGGKELPGHLQHNSGLWHSLLGGGRDGQIAWSHFCWLAGPQSLPSMVAVTDWIQGGGIQVFKKNRHCGTKRILSATDQT